MQQFEVFATNDVRGSGTLAVWLDHLGMVEQVWSIQRLTPVEFRVVGDTLGVVCQLEGPVFGEWVAPINPATGRPYFKARTKDVLDALDDLSGLVRFATGGCAELVGSKLASDVNAARDWGGVSPQLDLPEAEVTPAFANVDQPGEPSPQQLTVTYRVEAFGRVVSAALSHVRRSEVEDAIRTLRRALSGKA